MNTYAGLVFVTDGVTCVECGAGIRSAYGVVLKAWALEHIEVHRNGHLN